MKESLLTLALALAIFVGFVVQEFIPPLAIAEGARVLFAPALFCFGACLLPFPSMLVLAMVAGFLSDFTTMQVVHRTVEIGDLDALQSFTGTVEMLPGWSILLFVASGLICQGVRPLVLRGQLWLPPLMSAVTTMVFLSLQFAVLTMRRFDGGGFFWSETVTWRILVPSLIAALLTLLLVVAGLLAPIGSGLERRALRDY